MSRLSRAAAVMSGDHTQTIATEQIVSSAPMPGAQPASTMDDISETFFADGHRQEASGVYLETPLQYRGSLDRIPRHGRPGLLFVVALFALGAGVAWWMGWRPPATWNLASLWQAARDLAGR
jgi:hypothetical protein